MQPTLFSLALFGPFEARYDDVTITNFATDKIRALLAFLAIEAGRPHRRESLSALLWPNYSDEVALRNLRQSLYRLRQTLQKLNPNLPDQLITQDRLTVTFHPQAVSLDVANFLQFIPLIKNENDISSRLEQIISLYRGDLLEGLSITGAYAFEEWLNIQRQIFHQQMVEALNRFLSLKEAQNDYSAILNFAPKLLILEPWHEEAHRQLMRALLQNGNRSQAIAHYHELRTKLIQELGIDPSPATVALFKQIEIDSAFISSPSFGAITSDKTDAIPRPNHIPLPTNLLIGRQSELDYLLQTLDDPACRLLTITGPGGIGKTRLCIEVAQRLTNIPNKFLQGIYFVSLTQVEHVNQLIPTIAQVLGISIQPRPDILKEFINQIKNQNILLILDNFEHLLTATDSGTLPSATSFIVDTLKSVPEITIIITSRESLGIQSEWVYPIEGLSYTHLVSANNIETLKEPAPQLFIQNAKRYNIVFDPYTNTDAILEICRLTDGLPLALEMAATWMRIYTCQEIAQNIAQNLDFLTSPFRDIPPRQRSIRVILNSSWELLTPDQQTTLMALCVFRGGFSIQATLFVTEARILDLSILVEKSLLRRNKNNRYFLHELVSQFAYEKLIESGRENNFRERHAAFYIADLVTQTVDLSGSNPADALSHIRQDLDNLRVAWDWSSSFANLPLIEKGMKGLSQFWVLTGANQEGETSIQNAISTIQKIPQDMYVASIHSYLMSSLAWLQMGIGKNEEAEKNLQIALELADNANNAERRAIALSHQGWLWQNQGRLDESEAALNEACAIFEKNGNQLQLSFALIRIGSVYWWRNKIEKSLEYYEQSLNIEKNIGNKRGINRAYGGLGMAYMNLEKFDQALEYLEKALQLDRELGNRPGTVRNLGHLGNIYLRQGKYEKAAASYQEALEIEQKTGSKNTSSIWLSNLGRVYSRFNDYATALNYYEQSIAVAKETGSRHQLCEALLGKAGVFLKQNRLDDSQPLIEEGLTISYEIDRKDTKLSGMILKARWLSQNGELQKARQLLESSRETLASEYKETETNARFFYELWKIDRKVEDAQEALTLYESCQSRAKQMEYTERITELSSFLKNKD